MSDVVVTVPKNFTHPAGPGLRGLAAWLAEGDAAGEPWTGQTWVFSTWGFCPDITPGERVYVVCNERLVGYAPLVRLIFGNRDVTGQATPKRVMDHVGLVRGGGAVACTIPDKIIGFRGWRRRWWNRSIEVPLDLEQLTAETTKPKPRPAARPADRAEPANQLPLFGAAGVSKSAMTGGR